MDEELLKKLFVGRRRRDLLNRMEREIEKAVKDRTPRYYLIIGPRGIGKSHFITLLYYGLRKLKDALCVKLSEEEFSVYRASDLFLRIFEEIEGEEFNAKYKMENGELIDAILEDLKSKNKMIIIFIENLHQIFQNQMNKKEIKRLRSIFQGKNIFIVVATSPLIFDAISHGDEPFYNFFNIKHLRELNGEEIREMVGIMNEFERKLVDMELRYRKMDSIVKITGGNPRIVILLYDLISRGEILDVEKAFFKILDEQTPYYQDVFRDLTGQRRRIFDILISLGKPATPKEIAEAARLDNNVVVTQLRRLEKGGYVLSHRMGKYAKYEVRERLFRLWRAQRQPFGRKRISILIEFLRLWYTLEEREKEFLNIMNHLRADDGLIRIQECLFSALPSESKMKFDSDLAEKFYELGIPALLEELVEAESEKYNFLGENEKRIRESRIKGTSWIYRGIGLLISKRYEEALQAFDEALRIDSESTVAWFNKGRALLNLQRYEEALQAFDEALRIDLDDYHAWINRGVVSLNLQRYEEALQAFDEALRIDPDDSNFRLDKSRVHLQIAAQEFRKTNYGDAIKNLNSAMDSFIETWDTKREETKEIIIDFFKDLTDFKQIEAIDISLKTMLKKRKGLTEFLEPISAAVEIVETKNLNKYYDLQVEERNIVVDIVRKLTESEELLLEEYKSRGNARP